MKKNSLVLTSVLSLLITACGGKDNSSGSSSSSFSVDPNRTSTVTGYLSQQQPTFEVGATTYQLAQGSYPIINSAFQAAQQQGIQPVLINGAYKYRARITGSMLTQYTQQGYPQPQQQPQPQYNTGTLNVVQAVIIR